MFGYHLWQTGNSKTKNKINDTILKQVTWDYMGSAEFEYGALPKALANFLYNPEEEMSFGSIVVKVVDFIGIKKVEKDLLFRYWVRTSQEEQLREALSNLPQVKRDLKETLDIINKENPVIFCIDKNQEFFAWTKKTFKKQMLDVLPNTIKVLKENEYMSS